MNEKKLFSPVYESLFYFFLDFVVDKLILIEFFLGSYLTWTLVLVGHRATSIVGRRTKGGDNLRRVHMSSHPYFTYVVHLERKK
jgi:hypothetical protein